MDSKLIADKLLVLTAHPLAILFADLDLEFFVSRQKGLLPKAFGIEDDAIHIENDGGYLFGFFNHFLDLSV